MPQEKSPQAGWGPVTLDQAIERTEFVGGRPASKRIGECQIPLSGPILLELVKELCREAERAGESLTGEIVPLEISVFEDKSDSETGSVWPNPELALQVGEEFALRVDLLEGAG